MIAGMEFFQSCRATWIAGPQTMTPRPNGRGTGILSQVSSWTRRVVRAARGTTGTPDSAANCATPKAA
jgi:hypothetical protein